MSELVTGPMLRVGDLAKAAGLTVRTLHHYEQIGILQPTSRNTAGHRLYGGEAVTRLYQLVRLRSLGMSLHQIQRALDDPDVTVDDGLRRHLTSIDRQMTALAALRDSVRSALRRIDGSDDPSDNLLEVLSTMNDLAELIRGRISIMVYQDPAGAHRYLTDVFGFSPGEITIDGGGRTVHAEVMAGDGVIWLHPESRDYELASPKSLRAATASMAVLVDDVDEHHALVVEKGGDIVYPPIDQPYGYREYSARDLEGALWSFMKEKTT